MSTLYDYTAITADDVSEITATAIDRADALVAGLVDTGDPRTYENTVRPLDDLGVVIGDANGRGSFMARVHPDDGVRQAAVVAEERMAKWANDLLMRPDLANAVKSYAETEDATKLT